jgi:hypothetical protein
MKTKFLLFVAIMSMTLTFAQSKQVDKILDNSEEGVSTVYNDGKLLTKTVYNDAKALSPKVEKAISSLAESFKTTTNNVWNILVKQQLVWSIGFLILTLSSMFNWCLFYKRNLNVKLTEKNFVKGEKDIIDKIPNAQFDSYYEGRNGYQNDIRSKRYIDGPIGKEDILIPIENQNNSWFKGFHLTVCVLLSIGSIYYFPDMLTGFINPEFGALKTIAKLAIQLK